MLKKLAQVENSNSFSNKFRDKRFVFFQQLIKNLNRPIKILEIGGTENFWKQRGFLNKGDFRITLKGEKACWRTLLVLREVSLI